METLSGEKKLEKLHQVDNIFDTSDEDQREDSERTDNGHAPPTSHTGQTHTQVYQDGDKLINRVETPISGPDGGHGFVVMEEIVEAKPHEHITDDDETHSDSHHVTFIGDATWEEMHAEGQMSEEDVTEEELFGYGDRGSTENHGKLKMTFGSSG